MDGNYKLLANSLENLAKEYQDQVATYPEFVDVFDEAISDFYEAFLLLPNLMDEHLVSYEAVKHIIICHNFIERNLAIEERKTDESFESDDCWNLVRRHASLALEHMKSKQ